MSPRKTLATASRVLRQIEHDHRTLALILFLPCILIIIFRFVLQSDLRGFSRTAPLLLGIFPMVIMFLVTSIATLRERTTGTLDRLLVMPVSKLDFIFGYAIAFTLLAFAQASLACLTIVGLLNVNVPGGVVPLLLGALAAAFLGTALGLCVSSIATTEFQAIQLMPVFIIPQLLVCGLLIARDRMAQPLQWLATIAPITYSVDAMRQTSMHAAWTSTITRDILIVFACGVAALILGAATIRRQSR